jgi:hypothetical protein
MEYLEANIVGELIQNEFGRAFSKTGWMVSILPFWISSNLDVGCLAKEMQPTPKCHSSVLVISVNSRETSQKISRLQIPSMSEYQPMSRDTLDINEIKEMRHSDQ